MYVRWKYYLHSDKSRSLRPEIVESYRDVLTGMPRNRTIRYLGSFRERDFSNPKALHLYWRLIDEKLSLLRLSPEDEQKLRSKLVQRIPMPYVSLTRPPAYNTSMQPVSDAKEAETCEGLPNASKLKRFIIDLLKRVD